MRRNAWGIMAVSLSAWEAFAFATRRVPTVTATVSSCHARRRHCTRALVALWLIGLGRHLLR